MKIINLDIFFCFLAYKYLYKLLYDSVCAKYEIADELKFFDLYKEKENIKL